jgi:hypothetical protein
MAPTAVIHSCRRGWRREDRFRAASWKRIEGKESPAEIS